MRDYGTRFDPTVTLLDKDGDAVQNKTHDVSYAETQGPKCPNTTIGAYHTAYKAGEVSPTDIAKVLLDLVENDARHRVAFLSIKKGKVLAAADLSTKRYREGKAKGILDGVPVAIKGKPHRILTGHFMGFWKIVH